MRESDTTLGLGPCSFVHSGVQYCTCYISSRTMSKKKVGILLLLVFAIVSPDPVSGGCWFCKKPCTKTQRNYIWKYATPISWNRIAPIYSQPNVISVVKRWERCRVTVREWCSASLIYLHATSGWNTMLRWCYTWKDIAHNLHFLLLLMR